MWVLSIVDSDRAATVIPPTNASTRTTARPMRALRVLITVLLARAPAQARPAGPRRGHRDRPAPGSARVSKRHRAPRAPAGPVAGLLAAARTAAPGRGSSPGRATLRPADRTAGHPASPSSRRAA